MNSSNQAPPAASRALGTTLIDVVFGSVVAAIGFANLVLVHPVPGLLGLLLALLYLPCTAAWFRRRFGRAIPPAVKIVVGVFVLWFTLGVSDLGDRLD